MKSLSKKSSSTPENEKKRSNVLSVIITIAVVILLSMYPKSEIPKHDTEIDSELREMVSRKLDRFVSSPGKTNENLSKMDFRYEVDSLVHEFREFMDSNRDEICYKSSPRQPKSYLKSLLVATFDTALWILNIFLFLLLLSIPAWIFICGTSGL